MTNDTTSPDGGADTKEKDNTVPGTEQQIKRLFLSRRAHRGQITKLIGRAGDLLREPNVENLQAVEGVLDSIETKLHGTIAGIDDQLQSVLPVEELEDFIVESDDYVQETRAVIHKLRMTHQKHKSEKTPQYQQYSHQHNPPKKVNLPKLSLPKFDGDILQWTTYWEGFEAAVSGDSSLEDIQKFQYLRSTLEGEAKGSIEGLSLTSGNYKEAVEILKNRYGQTHKIVAAHMKRLWELTQPSDSVSSLKEFHDQLETNIRGLRSLGKNEDTYGDLLVPVILEKLPSKIKTQISRDHGNEAWSLNDLTQAINKEIEANQAGAPEKTIMSSAASFHIGSYKKQQRGSKYGDRRQSLQETSRGSYQSARSKGNHGSSQKYQSSRGHGYAYRSSSDRPTFHPAPCAFCKMNNHTSANCRKHNDPRERREIVEHNKLCLNCLGSGHFVRDCVSEGRCKTCQKKHHTALCGSHSGKPDQQRHTSTDDKKSPVTEDVHTTLTPVTEDVHATLTSTKTPNAVLLKTTTAKLWNMSCKSGVQANILMDEGSQRTFITDDTAQQLGLNSANRRSENINLSTFGDDNIKTQSLEVADFKLETADGELLELSALIVPHISTPVKNFVPLTVQQHSYLQGLKLASHSESDTFHIDLLIGSDYYWSIIEDKVVRGPGPTAVASKLGYLLSGPTGLDTCVYATMVHNVLTVPEDVLAQYWKLESIGIHDDPTDNMPGSETLLEDFKSRIDQKDGKYVVHLPWKQDHPPLPTNYEIAAKRTLSLINRIPKDMWTTYDKIIQDQLKHGFIETVNNDDNSEGHYIPHHSVHKDSTTTPLRIVYDCSCKVGGHPSLNDCLEAGPNLAKDITQILLRFRTHNVGLVSDIEKAFLNIELHEEDRPYTKFLWLENPEDPHGQLKTYQFKSILFGATSSPFILNAVIQYHLEGSPSNTTTDMLRNTYVDNLVTGTKDDQTATDYYHQSIQVMRDGGFNLRSWATNSTSLLKQAEEDNKLDPDLPFVKVLGMHWHTQKDTLCYKPQTEETNSLEAHTKRQVVRQTSTLFDPLGFLAPVHIRAKMLIQKLWTKGLQWDDKMDDVLQREWIGIQGDLETARLIDINRPYFRDINHLHDQCELHVFADASTKAYGAVAYLKRDKDCSFILAKSRVKPLKDITLPRLELLAAFVAAKMTQFLITTLSELNIQRMILWCDSQIVLHWISSKTRLPVFIENRVKVIRQTDFDESKYCSTAENPADLLTRGVSTEILKNSILWLKGPRWLATGEEPIWDAEDNKVLSCQSEDNDDATTQQPEDFSNGGIDSVINIERYSSLGKVLRITAYVLRFIKALKQRKTEVTGFISVPELNEAKDLLIKSIQRNVFEKELEGLKTEKTKSNALVRQLKLFLDDKGLIRCGGRLHNARLEYNAKHPILIPRNHHLTDLIIRWAHTMVLHARITSTVTYIRNTYWIPRIRQVVKKILRTCVTCRKVQGKPYQIPVVPPLPSCRINEAPPFVVTGVDFTGALYYKSASVNTKAYICLFTCAVTRAVHLEVVTDMTTKTFLQALRKFAARRSSPRHLISDNGSTFLSAASEIQSICKDDQVHNYLTSRNIQWTFIPKRAPWFGGFYERLVGVTKTALKKVLTHQLATLDELVTLVTEVEAVINDRPLTYTTTDLEEPIPLTPSMLLYGRMINTLHGWDVSEEDLQDPDFGNEVSLRRHLKGLDHKFQQLWSRWRGEYLPALREAHSANKQRGVTENTIRTGDVVQVHEDNQKRVKWPLALVTKLNKGHDGLVRSAEIRMKGGVSNRPIVKLYPLEVASTLQDDSQTRDCDKLNNDKHTDTPTNPGKPVRQAANRAGMRIKQWAKQLV